MGCPNLSKTGPSSAKSGAFRKEGRMFSQGKTVRKLVRKPVYIKTNPKGNTLDGLKPLKEIRKFAITLVNRGGGLPIFEVHHGD